MAKPISEYNAGWEFVNDYGNIPVYEKQREKLREKAKKLNLDLYTQQRLANERWLAKRTLKNIADDMEAMEWNGKKDKKYKEITGQCLELWHSDHTDNAKFLQNESLKHSRNAVKIDDEIKKNEKERKRIWNLEWKEREKANKIWNKHLEKQELLE